MIEYVTGIDIAPVMLLAMDAVLVVLLLIAIVVGLGVRRKLARLKSARDEWAREMATFAVQAEAAESGFSRMRTALVAEVAKQTPAAAPAQTQAARQPMPLLQDVEPAPSLQVVDPVAAPATTQPAKPAEPAAIMSMQ